MSTSPTLYWMRRDFRLADNPALSDCAGAPVIPVVIRDGSVRSLGAAPAFRWGRAVGTFSETLTRRGGRVILRTGDALEVLRALLAETGAKRVVWNRLYDPEARARDARIKSALKADGIAVESFNSHLIFEPWTVETKTGGPYRVYSPFWRAVEHCNVARPLPVPRLIFPDTWPRSEALEEWHLAAPMRRGASVVAAHELLGEEAARKRLDWFLDTRVAAYKDDRDRLDLDATSGLSEPLTYGEISPRQCWHAGCAAQEAGGGKGAGHFLKEVVWREFAYHLMYHTPEIMSRNWREDWDAFPWQGDGARAERWKQGQTGVEVIDAAMRELYVTGRMHNRARMLVASYLTKHLLVHWQVGMQWFADTLTDWDPASNAMGWQWVAGSGPDAAPFFRIFNPETQAEKFDPKARYRTHWLYSTGAEAFRQAIPLSWDLQDRPSPMIELGEGRKQALAAYETVKR
ncbi:cryptochrome/photolyase family protein [Nioella nitratireducens]|uniref:cryptochrome/photolyase family protein n=1 Tax=Nioella nitratireducens TaxID=1287720 RepID=UPI0008FD12B5|nr:deoxyribodipyrimidine photo-lyase [Nioella nitratireducens]